MLNNLEYVLFVFDMVDVLALDDFYLLHCLNCVLLALVVLDPAHSYISERTCTKIKLH